MALRIAHFTDIHVTESPGRFPLRALLSKRLAGWVNLKFFGRYAALADAPIVARALVRDLETQRPDHIVSTGDLTALSFPSEFESARDALAPLFGSDHITGIPGNHDVYVHSAVRDRLYDKWFGEWTRTDLERTAFPLELQPSYPYPLVRFLNEDVVLVCLYDVRPAPLPYSTGRVSEVQLGALKHVLEMPEVTRRVKVLALHYALCRANGRPDKRLHRLENAARVLSLAERGSVSLILHGHIHERFVHPPGKVATAAISNPGSLAHRENDMAYHIYSVDNGTITLEARRYDDGTGEFCPWPDAPGSGVLVREGG